MRKAWFLAAAVLIGFSGLAFAAPKKKKKAVKKKPAAAYDYKKSKYRAKAPDSGTTYRFDSRGNPVRPSAEKSAGGKKFEGPKLKTGTQSAGQE